MAEDAQPAEGQGAEATGSPFDSYLQTVPAEAKEAAEKWFTDTSKGLEGKLEEAAQFKKQWEPYGKIEGLPDPETLSQLVAWQQAVTQTPETFQEWLKAAAEEQGFQISPKEAAEVEADLEDEQDLTPERIQKLVDERVAAQVTPFQQQQEEWTRQQTIASEEAFIRDEWARLEKEHKVQLNDAQRAQVLDLGMQHEGDGSWVEHGFDRLKEIAAEANRTFVEDKTAQPSGALTGGGTELPKPPTSFKEAGELARERWRQAQS